MRVLLTGAAGSIGYHVIREILINTDWEIVGIDSFRHKGYHERIDAIIKEFGDKRLEVIQHDLCCPISEVMKQKIGPIDHILHLAAISDVFWGQENPVYTVMNNVTSTQVMCEYAKTVPHKTFVYFSTDEVYGPVEKGDAHPEWDTHRPSNFYSASKAMSEDLCYAYWRNGDIKLILTNTMNNFGEFQSDSKFPVKVQRAIEQGKEVIIHGNEKEVGTRYYIHSGVVARTLIEILKKGATEHKVGELDEPDRYHLVGNTCLSNLELAKIISGIMDKDFIYIMVDFHKDNPAHDIHYGLQNNKIEINDNFTEDMTKTIEWQTLNN